MNTNNVTLLISIFALSDSIGGFLSARQATWSMRYYERWFQLARLVLEHSETLLPLWCSAKQYERLYIKKNVLDREPSSLELVFAEMYIDFMMEVHRRGKFSAFITGRFPGRVPLTNPRTIHLWENYNKLMYSQKQQGTIERIIAKQNLDAQNTKR